MDHEWANLCETGPEIPVLGTRLNPEQHQAEQDEPSNESTLVPEAGPEQSIEGSGLIPEQPSVGKGQSNEEEFSELDDRRERDRRALELRFHSSILERHAALVVTPVGNDNMAPTNPEQLLANAEDARQVLSAIPHGDHVEIFGPVTITVDYPERSNNVLPPEARFAARTFNCWILPSKGRQPEIIPASSTHHYSSMSGSGVDCAAESHFALPDDRHFYAYADDETYDRFDEGAGRSIIRLPDNPLAPAPPEIGTTQALPSPESAAATRLVGDWRTAEDLAHWHMSGPLGFYGSQLTGGGSDRGVDVEHPDAWPK